MIDTESRMSMMPGSTGVTSKSAGSGDGNVPDKFPAGLRILVVDDDPTCLMILAMMLKKCDYEVTKSNRAEVALSLLRENKNGFDVVISDVHMPGMDGFKLLVHIGLEMDLPVIMMSADDSKSVVMKGVTHGACDYLIKPVRIEALRNIWQHVVRKRKHEWKDLEPSASLDDGDRQQKQPEDPEYSSFASEGHDCKNIKRRKGEEDEAEEKDDSSSSKKPRIAWTHELHQHFVAAVNHLGINKAVPKKILDLMNAPGLTRENVASHLQKFRQYLKKLEAQQSGGMNTLFRDNLDAGYGSFSELDLHSLAASGQVNQLSAQSHATLRATALGRSGNLKSTVSVPLVDQTNMLFSFDNPKLRYGNQHENNSNISKQMNFLHGIPTTMEQKQLSGFQRSFTGMHNSQAHDLALRRPVLTILAASQASSLLDIPGNHITELTGNGFSPRGNVEATSSTQGFVSSYGLLKNVNQNTTHDWGLQGVDLTFDPSQNRNNMQGGLNVLQHNYALGSKATLSVGEGSGSHIADNPSRTMAESIDYSEDHGHDDFLTAIFTQAEAENEYAYSWYSLDNLRA